MVELLGATLFRHASLRLDVRCNIISLTMHHYYPALIVPPFWKRTNLNNVSSMDFHGCRACLGMDGLDERVFVEASWR